MLPCLRFPQVYEEPIPFYKDPYKLFALSQITFLFWRVVQIAGNEGVFGTNHPNALAVVNGVGLGIHLVLNLKVMVAAEVLLPRSAHLKHAEQSMCSFLPVTLFDVLFPEVLDRQAGKDALMLRGIFVVIIATLSLFMVCYANRDGQEEGDDEEEGLIALDPI